MQRLRPLHSRHSNRAARYAMLYAVIVLSFLAGFLTPLTTPAFAAQREATQEADTAQHPLLGARHLPCPTGAPCRTQAPHHRVTGLRWAPHDGKTT